LNIIACLGTQIVEDDHVMLSRVGIFNVLQELLDSALLSSSDSSNNDKVDKCIYDEINQILKYYKLHVSSSIKKELLKIININLDCMFKQLKLKVKKSVLTKEHVKELIKQNKNLDIFK
jgi:hypothetical protein